MSKHPHEDCDGTPLQCDCFSRGEDYSFRMFVHHVNLILDGKDEVKGVNMEPWGTLRRRILKLVNKE
jgi:hypothetical protein